MSCQRDCQLKAAGLPMAGRTSQDSSCALTPAHAHLGEHHESTYRTLLTGAVAAAALLAFGSAPPALAQTLTAQQQLAFDIYKELVEINTVTATGDTGRAADAMAARLRAAGFSGDDVQVF